MAAKVKSTDLFGGVYEACIAHAKAERGLGNRFHSALIMLLNENPNADKPQLVKLFEETLTEVENTHLATLKAELGEDATPKDMRTWTQYKSDFKRALEMVDRSDLMKCNGVRQVKDKLIEVRQAMKEKAAGGASNDSGTPADSKAETHPGFDNLPGGVKARLGEALKILSNLPESAALEVAESFKKSAAHRLRTLGQAKKKVGAVHGKSVAVNAGKVNARH